MIGKITILNSKDRKILLQTLNEIYGIEELPELTYFYQNKKEKLYVVNKEVFEYDLHEIRTNAMGLYIGTFMVDGFRFSIDGSQIFGKLAKKNIFDVSEKERNEWIKGEDLFCEEFENEYVLIKCGEDFLCSAKVKDGIIKNHVSKSRKQKKVFGED